MSSIFFLSLIFLSRGLVYCESVMFNFLKIYCTLCFLITSYLFFTCFSRKFSTFYFTYSDIYQNINSILRNKPSGISDTTLRKIGKAIVTNLDDMATELDVDYSELKRYKDENDRSRTAEGTIIMLFEWRERVKPSEQRLLLQGALTRARLIRIRNQYLP